MHKWLGLTQIRFKLGRIAPDLYVYTGYAHFLIAPTIESQYVGLMVKITRRNIKRASAAAVLFVVLAFCSAYAWFEIAAPERPGKFMAECDCGIPALLYAQDKHPNNPIAHFIVRHRLYYACMMDKGFYPWQCWDGIK